MNFQDLHECLRLELVRRINSGLLTGTLLARQAGFRQAHMSNFLNRKRSLSLEGLDRVLEAQNLSIESILPVTLSAMATSAELTAEDSETLPIVTSSAALEDARIVPSSVIETIRVSASRLYANRARTSPRRAHWQRFLAIRLDAQQAAPMEPVLSNGSIAILDRHYNSLAPYSSHQPTLYAIRIGKALAIRYIGFEEERLILRPCSPDYPVQLLSLDPGEIPSDRLLGRVCMLFSEL